MQPRRHLLPLLLAISALFYLNFILRTSFEYQGQRVFTLVDDAMISMRYARNLAHGHGLAWNIGQPPVEGFTNLGWTLVMALIHLIPFSPTTIALVVMLIAVVILSANTFVVFQVTETLDPSARFAPLIAAAISAFYFPLVFWTLRGLEVGALTLTLSLALLLTFRTRQTAPKPDSVFWLSLLLSLALLLRMDAALPVALILLYLASKNLRAAVLPAIAAVVVLMGILLFQKAYFGDFFPNTYYLKVYGISAWERVRVGLLVLHDHALRDFLLLLTFPLVGLFTYKDLRSRESLLLLALFFAQAGYSVWVGGDYAEELVDSANRFIAQGMPALFILVALFAEQFLRDAIPPALQEKALVRVILAFTISLGALFTISGEPWRDWIFKNAPLLPTDFQRARVGLHIKEYTSPDAVIAVHAAGQIPYFSERTTIDILGKNDAVIAKGAPVAPFTPGHNKWNYEYSILQLRPDVIADNFSRLKSFMEGVAEYQQLPNGIYIRVDSTRVDVEGLSREYK